jgi:hypothetical protein
MAISMEKECNSSTMVIGMRVTIQMENHKAKEIIIGAMVRYIRDSLKMDSGLGQVFGNLVDRNMKEPT